MSFFGCLAGAIGGVFGCVGKLAMSLISVVGPAISAICKALGLMKQEEKVEDLGDKAIQAEEAGIRPEDYKRYKDYMNAVENFEVNPEKSKNISQEDKLRRGTQMAAGALQEQYPNAQIEKLIELSANNPGIFTDKRFAELGKLVAEDPESMNTIVNYLEGTDKSGSCMAEAIKLLGAMEKAENPRMSDMDVAEKVLNMR